MTNTATLRKRCSGGNTVSPQKLRLDSYLAEFMWRSKLNNRDPFETTLKDIAEFWESHKA
ncbi:DDE Tnp IS1595 domain-containing protein [Aphis craccivora]|uniref:DDE Tnp IS1595 domain-containing protein n=1 Tax=Aphis craccivora TaxID=307492 RepID=A0A6G0VWF4_APHCR|nr:DDE Tnp IS1595 domain-containing protein [Aphis craccivora]